MSGDYLERLQTALAAPARYITGRVVVAPADIRAALEGAKRWQARAEAAEGAWSAQQDIIEAERRRADAAERELAEMRAERGNGMAWDDWCVRILVSGGAVTTDHDDEGEARGRYEYLIEDPECARQFVRDATSYPSPIRRIELLCRTCWEGDYRVVESVPWQPGSAKEQP